jgi:hypothetical protein
MLRIILAFAIASLCFVHFSLEGLDSSARVVDREACSHLVKDACTLVEIPLSDMTLSFIKSRRTYVTNSSTVVSSLDIHAQD